jgi:hypothetical protein
MENQTEWLPIPGFDGYSVSNTGLIKSEGRMVRGKLSKRWNAARILKSYGSGPRLAYLSVTLRKENASHQKKIHVIVAAVFLGPRPHLCDVDHINGDTTNNHVSNLRYLNRSTNRSQGPLRRFAIATETGGA